MNLIKGRWYKKYINSYEDKLQRDTFVRGYFSKKEKLAQDYCLKYQVPDITDGEKDEIQRYWSQYGIIISDFSWHRMYYHVTGIHDPRFVPDLVAGLVVYDYYNNKVYENTWRDKNMFSRLLPGVPFPRTIMKRIRGRFYVDEKYAGTIEQFDAAERLLDYVLERHCDVIVKKTRETGFGKGVGKYHIETYEDAKNAIDKWEGVTDYIVQECVRQHEYLAEFNESSINMMRVYSWRHDGDVSIIFATVRAGVKGSITDVSFDNGVELVHLVGISSDGYFGDKMYDQDGRVIKTLETKKKVPGWEKMIRIIRENHLLINDFDIIGWDFTIDQSGEPVCFEWNIQWPGTVLYQYVNGPLWGDKTDDILSFLKDKENQYNYVPVYMSIYPTMK